ncbi:helix-turn-helix domain-containing protein [Nocardia africana]|uniref:Helix-turn-helix n=2 Tax=Nocardia africana TaxID=134964 RepID=A0A378X1C9_9NOCA|nr:helix-turn-helix transcriptional regulator [Nocardia africana]MCC3318353.1 helix-turn-helix transcriptional regulator [Nocardia africana]SUA47416.1 Helix-turn-helix [Nocardia africana]
MKTPQLKAAQQAAEAFAAEVAYWRENAGLGKKALAVKMGFDPSYVSHIEAGRHKPTEDFARKADAALNSGDAIWRRWRDFEAARAHGAGEHAAPLPPRLDPALAAAALVCEHDAARLDYDGAMYWVGMRRLLRNTGTEPVTRYLIRIAVDRYPGEPDQSRAHYRQHPLTWDELALTATCRGEPMRWEIKHDLDAFKEAWLLFENAGGRFPLYPGESVWIEYGYSIGEDKWGRWFQRAVRLPTARLEVQMAFPAALDPVVWGIETSPTADARPIATPPARTNDNEAAVFTWNTTSPPLHTRYRMEWRFRSHPENH